MGSSQSTKFAKVFYLIVSHYMVMFTMGAMETTTHTWTQGCGLQVDTVSEPLVVSVGNTKKMVRRLCETTPEGVCAS